MDKVKKKRLQASLILLVISLGVALLIGEMLIQQLYPLDTGTSFQFRIPHPVLGWTLEPGAYYVNRMPEASVPVKYNSKGWRDTEHDIDNHNQKPRVLVLGDSFMEAYSVRLEDAFPKQLERLARKKGIDVEVLNLGVGGYGTLQEYLAFRDVGRLYRPDIVLLGFFLGNDVRNNSFTLESAVQSYAMKVKSRPFLDESSLPDWKVVQADYEGALARYLSTKEQTDTLLQRWSKRSALVYASIQLVEHIKRAFQSLGRNPNNNKARVKSLQKSSGFLAARFGVYYCKDPPGYAKAWSMTQQILRRLNNDIRDSGGRLFVFTVPGTNSVVPRIMEKLEGKFPRGNVLCLEEATAFKRLTRILQELGIARVELLWRFRSVVRDDGISLYRRSDQHWNKAGHNLAAAIVLSALLENRLLPLPDPAR